MRIQDVIARKRDNAALSADEIGFFVHAYTRSEIADYQASALLMAIYLRGMNEAETASLTLAMAQSGRMLDLATAGLPPGRPTIDKHSTGGVGDKASLIVVPLLASAGALVCKMSGRGLGHTGGTLDKLESIKGFRVGLTPQEMTEQVARIGACLAGQTDDLAPADKKLYALRDATATVGSLPLIVSSILSKKLAGGAEAFLFDVKAGSGALMKTPEEAEELARALVDGAVRNGRRAVAVLSDMDAPLGRTIGNALEVREAIDVLTPDNAETADRRLRELCVFLAGEGLALARLAPNSETGRARAAELLESGAALASFRAIVEAQGGDAAVVDNPGLLPCAPVVIPVASARGGYVARIDAQRLGEIVVMLGGGRGRKEDAIDPAVGLVVHAPVGAQLAAGGILAEIHAQTDAQAENVRARIADAFTISDQAIPIPPLIRGIVTG